MLLVHGCTVRGFDVSKEPRIHVTSRFGRDRDAFVIEIGFVFWFGVSVATGIVANTLAELLVQFGGEQVDMIVIMPDTWLA